MNSESVAVKEYRSQIVRYAQSLAVANNDAIARDLGPGMSLERVKLFTEGNFEKRFLKLKDQLELLEETFDDLDDRVRAYINEVPLAAYDTGSSDLECFLDRICSANNATSEQFDAVTCQKSRINVEGIAAKNRLGHVRFQELWSRAADLSAELEFNPTRQVSLNPITVEATLFTHALLDEEDSLPAKVIFYPVGNDIRTAILESDAQQIVRQLECNGPLRLEELVEELDGLDGDQIVEILRDLAEIGLAVFG